MTLILLLMLVNSALPQCSASDPCELELAELRRSVRILENKLLIGAWQLDHLRSHQYFHPLRPSQPDPEPEPESGSDPANNQNSNQTVDYKSSSLLPPAGSLIVYDKDCSELYDRLRPVSGFYRIRPSRIREPFLAYCDMEDGGGWTVFQRRRRGRVDFNRDWVDYRDGFGDLKLWNDEFWLGNENIHTLLSEGKNLMKIELMDWGGQKTHAFYENFRISNEEDKYRLQYGVYSGRAGDALSGGGSLFGQWSACLGGMQFSTKDQDNDRYLQGSCAQENKGGWWYNRCHTANLNGKYYKGGDYRGDFDNGVVWGPWKGLWYSLKHTTMKVRPLVFLDSLGSGAGED
ncbi:fibrinogen like 1B [Aplochiton taeniatus]